MQQYKLGSCPNFIEPLIDVLEVTGADGHDALGWIQLQRVSGEAVFAQFPTLPEGLVHFFGRFSRVEENDFLVAYNCAGRLTALLRHSSATGWCFDDLPAELTGSPVIKPSVRLVFKTERARAVFVHYINQLMGGQMVNPALAVVIDQLDEPPRMIDIWGSK